MSSRHRGIGVFACVKICSSRSETSNVLIHQEKDGTFSARLADLDTHFLLAEVVTRLIFFNSEESFRDSTEQPVSNLSSFYSSGSKGNRRAHAALIRADIFGLG